MLKHAIAPKGMLAKKYIDSSVLKNSDCKIHRKSYIYQMIKCNFSVNKM